MPNQNTIDKKWKKKNQMARVISAFVIFLDIFPAELASNVKPPYEIIRSATVNAWLANYVYRTKHHFMRKQKEKLKLPKRQVHKYHSNKMEMHRKCQTFLPDSIFRFVTHFLSQQIAAIRVCSYLLGSNQHFPWPFNGITKIRPCIW